MFEKLIFVFCIIGLVSASNATAIDGVPRLELPAGESGYHGLVKENETLVEVTPRIRAVGAQICSFRIVNKHHGEAPFQIILKGDGEAELHARRMLNCEKRKNYKFDIAAVSCTGEVSDNATVHISVVDMNEYAPIFLEPAYVCQVDEGRLYHEIVRVEATDRDCTPKYGDVCKYEILTTDQPFIIDNEGAIRNTEPLDYERSHNHILSVVAYDCGMKQSIPVMVTIKVNRICKLGWKGIPERIDYAPGTGREDLFPNAELELCDVPCTVRGVSTKLSLATSHIGKGCDRDTYSVQSQRKLCGASMDSVDLLPSPGIGSEWTKPLPTDEGRESDQIFEFDGATSAVAIPSDVLDHELAQTFTIATWMKHKQNPEQDKHVKEHILCSADDHKMNRHHYALFVRNCRLILLLRRDFSEGEGNLNIFRPAEWRWKIPQVCDNEWHHYAVSIKFPEITLYVDGQLFKAEKKNPEIIDDWPLHPTKGINTTLTVGACWQGSDNKMRHHFRGYLAGLSVLLNKNEKPEVLSCLHKCKESLEVPAMELLEPGMELLTNSDLTELSIEGDNKTNLVILVRKVGYTNSRQFPTPGRRNLHLTTTVTCDRGRPVKVPAVESYVMVLQPQQPNIDINGTGNVAREYEDFRLGVRIFTDVRITIGTSKSPSQQSQAQQQAKSWKHDTPTSALEKQLDSCTVSVYPPLNPDHEIIILPENLLKQFGIIAKVNKDGVVVMGADAIYNYEQVLRQIQYSNRKPAYYLNRVFKLACSELNGRFMSNEYVQTLTVIHPRLSSAIKTTNNANSDSDSISGKSTNSAGKSTSTSTNVQSTAEAVQQHEPAPAHARLSQHHAEVRPPQAISAIYVDGGESTQAVIAGGSHAVTIIVAVCVGFLILMIVLGVIRIRAAHHRAAQEEMVDTEMAWDDSALTITVNPMEQLDNECSPRCEGSTAAGTANACRLGSGTGSGQHRRRHDLDADEDMDDDDETSDDDDDDNSSYRDEDEGDSTDPDEGDADEAGRAKMKDLEWDNSTLAI